MIFQNMLLKDILKFYKINHTETESHSTFEAVLSLQHTWDKHKPRGSFV